MSTFGIATVVGSAGDDIGVSCMSDGAGYMGWWLPGHIGVGHM